jgi:tetratricopeptide (TPR) repeat protein
MLLTERPEPTGARKRHRRILPGPSLATRPFEGAALLDELEGTRGALFTWARDVALWVQTPPDQRSGLFWPDAPRVLDLQGPSARAAAALRGLWTHPESVRSAAVAEACTSISEWAENEGGLASTAIYFAELAASASEDDALLALAAGRVNRRYAVYERARHWYERGIDLARAHADRPAQAAGYLSWGNMEFQRGRHASARRFFVRAWRTARKFHLREEGGAARHNLMTLALERGKFDEAQDHALAAFRFYGRQHGRMPYFAHDVAQLWAWQRFYSAAYPVFLAAVPLITHPKERIKLLANLGRAAAGLGESQVFFDAWQGVTAYVPRPNEHLAEAYVNIGEGALLLGLAAQAHDVGSRALALARERGESSTEAQAEALLSKVRTPTAPLVPLEPPDTVKALSRWLLQTLQERAAPSM